MNKNKKTYQMKKSHYLELQTLQQVEIILEQENIAYTNYINNLVLKDLENRKNT